MRGRDGSGGFLGGFGLGCVGSWLVGCGFGVLVYGKVASWAFVDEVLDLFFSAMHQAVGEENVHDVLEML